LGNLLFCLDLFILLLLDLAHHQIEAARDFLFFLLIVILHKLVGANVLLDWLLLGIASMLLFLDLSHHESVAAIIILFWLFNDLSFHVHKTTLFV